MMAPDGGSTVVVGGGLGGLRTCVALREQGYDGTLRLVGAEAGLPYDRPPLSKGLLRNDLPPGHVTLRSADELAALDIEFLEGARAVGLAVAERTVHLAGGTSLSADHVVVATGARPRRLPGRPLEGVFALRTLADAVALREVLTPGARVVVVGAGFIGLEVAATATGRGCAVTVLDPLAAPLARVLDPRIGAALARMHASQGVEIRCGAGVAGIVGDERVERVVLDDGSAVEADVVVVGIGVVPDVEWLADSGLVLGNGLRCDETLQAAPGIWAVGDVCEWPAPALGAHVRVEHWTNATEQATHVARAILGGCAPFDPVPYLWSDQYDAKLQVMGFAGGGDELAVVDGALDEPKWVVLIGRAGRLAAVAGLGSPAKVMRLRAAVAAALPWDEALAQYRPPAGLHQGAS